MHAGTFGVLKEMLYIGLGGTFQPTAHSLCTVHPQEFTQMILDQKDTGTIIS